MPPPTAAPSEAPAELFQRALAEERLQNARRLNLYRMVGVGGFLVVSAVMLATGAFTVAPSLAVFACYWALADVETDVRGRHVVVVEDIGDTGLTRDVVVARRRAHEPASVRRCALLVREDCPRPEFVGFTIGQGFVVGYGIDYAEQYRGLRDIRVLV